MNMPYDFNVCDQNPDSRHSPIYANSDPDIADTHVSVICLACGATTGYPIADFAADLRVELNTPAARITRNPARAAMPWPPRGGGALHPRRESPGTVAWITAPPRRNPMTESTTSTAGHDVDGTFYVLFAEGGGWPDHCVGPFFDFDAAEEYIASDKWRESWGSIDTDPRGLPVHALADTCSGCAAAIFRDRHGNYIDTTGGDTCEDRGHHPQPAANHPDPLQRANAPWPVHAEAADTASSARVAPQFELDVDAARAKLAEAVANDDTLLVWSGSPGRAIEGLFFDLSEHMVCPPGYDRYDIGVYSTISDYGPDGVLVVVRRPAPLLALAEGPWDWNDLAPDSWFEGALSVDEALGTVADLIGCANDLLARAEHSGGQ